MTDQNDEVAQLRARLEQLEGKAPPSPPAKAEGGLGKKLLIGAGVIVGLFVVMLAWGAHLSSSPCTDSAGAKDYAQRASELLLKYPQTAKFDLTADELPECRWHVHGTVSAQNGFGLFIPKDIDVTLKGDEAAKSFKLEQSNLVADAVSNLN